MRTRLIVAAIAAAFSLAAGSATAPPAAGSASGGQTARVQALEASIVKELNRVRDRHGLRPVTVSSGLAAAAIGHSAWMISSGVFDHASADGTSFDQRLLRTYPVRGFASWTVGENLLYSSRTLDGAGAVQAWMDSPPHRRNMLSPSFREVGVGALHTSSASGDFGGGAACVVTLDFGARVAAGSAARKVAVTAGAR